MLDVKHFLNIYKIRKRLHEEGITNPLPEIKIFITELINRLSSRDPDKLVNLVRNENAISELRSKSGEVIIIFPDFENLASENNITKPQ